MKATEFRVGNLFKDKEGNILTCLGVTDESHENKGIVWYGEELGFYLDLDECNAIPLTEQWLIDFGFSGGEGHYSTPFHNYFRYYKNGNISFFGIKFENKHKIKYVHQLQNICWCLTGNELTLNQ